MLQKSPTVPLNLNQNTMFAVDRDGAKLHFRGLRWALIIERSSAKVEDESLHKPAVLPIWNPKRTGSRKQKFYTLACKF
jgi:hypothetical protein